MGNTKPINKEKATQSKDNNLFTYCMPTLFIRRLVHFLGRAKSIVLFTLSCKAPFQPSFFQKDVAGDYTDAMTLRIY